MHPTRIRMMILAVPIAGILMGCQPVWTKAGEGPNDFAATTAECQALNRRGFYGAGISGMQNAQAELDRCIAAHGYTQVMPRDLPAGAGGHYGPAAAGQPATAFIHGDRG